ncbi:hypothetical protein KSP40_PGU015599 [Platanthera guangdongensis]|uniref:Uncharacterized protein n=1 Tax=Platanthera guangdongensis TaxID=2320717 RepID=A0ABR2MKA3_9ASPA
MNRLSASHRRTVFWLRIAIFESIRDWRTMLRSAIKKSFRVLKKLKQLMVYLLFISDGIDDSASRRSASSSPTINLLQVCGFLFLPSSSSICASATTDLLQVCFCFYCGHFRVLQVRQLTITIRTIINGLCYLATFAFGLNSVGLVLYSIQLAFSSVMEGASNNSSSIKSEDEQSDAVDPSKSSAEENESDSRNEEFSKSSDEP